MSLKYRCHASFFCQYLMALRPIQWLERRHVGSRSCVYLVEPLPEPLMAPCDSSHKRSAKLLIFFTAILQASCSNLSLLGKVQRRSATRSHSCSSHLLQAVLHAFSMHYDHDQFSAVLSLGIFPALHGLLLSDMQEEQSEPADLGQRLAQQIAASPATMKATSGVFTNMLQHLQEPSDTPGSTAVNVALDAAREKVHTEFCSAVLRACRHTDGCICSCQCGPKCNEARAAYRLSHKCLGSAGLADDNDPRSDSRAIGEG